MPGFVPGSDSRPADVFLPLWDQGKPAALDISVVCPLQKALVSSASERAGHALEHANERKRRTHHGPCERAGITFVPMVGEALGGWEGDAASHIRRIAKAQGSRLGILPQVAIPRLIITFFVGLK